MKKLTMLFTGVLLVLSLAACTPTPVKQAETAEMPQIEASTGGASDKVPDPNVEPMEIISIYSSNEEATGLNQAMDAVDELSAQAIVDKLIEYGVLEEGTEVLKFDMAEGVGTLDLSKVPTSGTAGESLMLAAIGNTFTENFELDRIKLLVNGENYSSGHIEQGDDDYLEFQRNYEAM